ncbi:MAG TPA: outer membrane beta-barrel protein [Labilithrix sp.]|nr:outer membrane beta-barrel protein [Labilithrix sp.]
MKDNRKAHHAVRTGIVLLTIATSSFFARTSRADDTPDGGAPAPSAPQPAAEVLSQTAPTAPTGSPPSAPAGPATPSATPETAPAKETPKVTVGGYVEAYYAYNFGTPANGVTNYRWVDNRHNTLQLSTAVLDVAAEMSSFRGRIALQAGPTADGWYADSVEGRVGASGAAPLQASTWKHIQQASVGWKAPLGSGLLIEAGLFLTTIGFEGAAIKDNWNWSRSSAFLMLPFYHVGARATYELTERLTAMAMVTNGWNSASDTNDGKSGQLQLTYKIPDKVALSFLYMGGPERAQSSPEGRPIRHLFDGWAQFDLHERFSVAAHGDVGFENNAFGVQSWRAGALYARVQPLSFLYVAARGDAFFEDVPQKVAGTASSLFFGSDVWSLTGTIDLRPIDHISFRTEYRHDVAGTPLFFREGAARDPDGALIANARTQDTLTLGMTGWF